MISANSLPGGGTTDYAVEIFYEALAHGKYECFLEEDTVLPMMYMPDLLKATVGIMRAERSDLTRSTYNLAAMSFTPAQLAVSIKRHVPDFEMIYKPDFRQEIAATWPRVIDDSCAQEDWNWQPDYDLDAMTDDIVAQLVPRIKLVKQAQEAAEASSRQVKRPPPPPSKSGM